jgi:lysophospholipase L1-like esterase
VAADSAERTDKADGGLRSAVRAGLIQFAIVLATLGAAEAILRLADLRFLRESTQIGQATVYRYDAELGWSPTPNSVSPFVGSRAITVRHNSLGLRDIEPEPTSKQTILILGDSFVWGYDVEAEERFTDLLRRDLPGYRIVNAGVSGYGTDQEYLLLQRLWQKIEPNIVVLMFTLDNDHQDNSSNSRYDNHYKPYFAQAGDGEWQLRGQPVPHSRHFYYANHWLAHQLWLARVATAVYLQLRHPPIAVPDPTAHLITAVRDYVSARGATFLMGVQRHDAWLENLLRTQDIHYASLDGAEVYRADGFHWTPKGHELVAARMKALLSDAEVGQGRRF